MKSKVSMDVNNYDMSLIKLIINCILYPINHIFNNSIVNRLFNGFEKINYKTTI